ncbi:MAG: hypothetical protein QNK11_06715, partial [Legionella sp.]|nr:hypothetical protein [Legionella sp.]
DIAMSEEEIPYLKAAEYTTFVEGSRWAEKNFEQFVHPYSNSISGTMLCQIRAIAKLRGEGKETPENLPLFTRLLACNIILMGGGHTLYEFSEPFNIPEIEKEFSHMGFSEIYRFKNEAAFEKGLEDVIAYNNVLLTQQVMHAMIKGEEPITLKNAVLDKFILDTASVQQLDMLEAAIPELEKLIQDYNEKTEVRGEKVSANRSEKNELLKNGLSEIIQCIKAGDVEKVPNVIANLKRTLVSQHGVKTWLSGKSKSYQLVKKVEESVSNVTKSVQYKEKTAAIRKASQADSTETADVKPFIPKKQTPN